MPILNDPWPDDLDPSRVPFRQRTITVLKGMGLWDDMTRIDEQTVDDIEARIGVKWFLAGWCGGALK